MKHFISVVGLIVVFSWSFGQDYTVQSLDLPKSNSRGAYFQGLDKDGYIYALGYRKFNFLLFTHRSEWIKVLNSNTGNFVADEKIDKKEVYKRGYRFESFQFIEGRPVFIVTKRELGDNGFYAFDLDPSLNLLRDAYKIGEKATCTGFRASSSKNFSRGVDYFKDNQLRIRTYLSDVSCSNEDGLDFYAITLNENNNKLFEVAFTIPVEGVKDKSNLFVHDNKLYYSIGVTTREKVDGRLLRQNVTRNYLFVVDEYGGVTEMDISLAENQSASEVSFVQSGNNVFVNGQIVDVTTNRLEGLFSAKLNTSTNQLEEIKRHYFDRDFITMFWTEREIRRADRRSSDPSFSPNFILVDRFDTDDEGAVYLYQKRQVEIVTTSTMSASGFYTTTTSYHYYYTDVITVKMNANGEMAWVKLIPLFQRTVDYDPGPSFIATEKGGAILVIHAASTALIRDIKSEERVTDRLSWSDRMLNQVAITQIDPLGQISVGVVADDRDDKIYFSPLKTGVDKTNHEIYLLNTRTNLFGESKKITLKKIRY